MFDQIMKMIRCECSAGCGRFLQVEEVDLVGYEVLLMVLGLGTLVSGSDDVP